MTWTGMPGEPYGSMQPEHDATVRLPIVGSDNPDLDEATALLPLVARGGSDATPMEAAVTAGSAGAAAMPPQADGSADHDQQSVVRNSAVMAAGSLVSRATGLLRTIAISAALGAAAVSNDYNLANTVPNMVYELLLGGVLASVLVPFLMRARLSDADRGEAYAQRLLTLATVLLGGATVLAVAAAPLLTRLFTLTARPRPTPDDLHLITTLSYLILPEIFFYGLAALLAAILNTRGHFAAPTWTPILNNIVVIATAAAFMVLPHTGIPLITTVTTAQVLVLGVGTTLGIVVQALGLVPALRSVRFHWRWRFDFRGLHLRELGRASGWMLVYVVVSQIALVVLLIIGYAVGAHRFGDGTSPPGIAIYNNAFLIFMMAHGIVAVSIMTALMPRLSAAAAEGRFADLAEQFSQGTRLSGVVLIPATAAYVVLSRPLAVTLFQWGEYRHVDSLHTATVIAVAALGLVPFAISQMQLFAFYAMPDTKTPALLNLPVAAVRILFYVLFFVVVPWSLITASLMLANTISYLLAVVLGYALLRRRIGRLGLGETMRALGRLGIAAAAGGLAAWFLVIIAEHTIGGGKVASIITLVAGGLVLLAVYIATAMALKARDVNQVAGLVRGRMGR